MPYWRRDELLALLSNPEIDWDAVRAALDRIPGFTPSLMMDKAKGLPNQMFEPRRPIMLKVSEAYRNKDQQALRNALVELWQADQSNMLRSR
jgi:hypothetical protein